MTPDRLIFVLILLLFAALFALGIALAYARYQWQRRRWAEDKWARLERRELLREMNGSGETQGVVKVKRKRYQTSGVMTPEEAADWVRQCFDEAFSEDERQAMGFVDPGPNWKPNQRR